MANTYTWHIANMNIVPSSNGQTNVVSKIYWYLEAFSSETQQVKNMDGSTNTIPYQATTNGETDVTYTAGSPFTAYNQLTQAEVIGWVQAALGATQVSALEAQLDAEIAAKISPQNTSLPLPWHN